MKQGETNEPKLPPRKGRGFFGRRAAEHDAVRITISRCVEQIADLRRRLDDQAASTQPERLAKLEHELAETGQGAQDMLSALDSVRSTVAEVTDRVHAMETSVTAPSEDPLADAVAALRADMARLRDEVTAVAADVATLSIGTGAISELEARVAELARRAGSPADGDDVNALREALVRMRAEVDGRLAASPAEPAAQSADLQSLREAVSRLEQDSEMRMQAPVSRLESTVLELDAKVTRALEAAERALWRTADPSDGAPAPADEMPHETIRLDTEIEARLQSAIGALEATRAEFHLKTNRAIDASNRALGRVSELSAQWAELPDVNARLAKVEAALGTGLETIGRLDGAVRLLEERLASVAQSLQRPVPSAPRPRPGFADLVAMLLDGVRELLPARVSGWLLRL
jgi:hypothetical protein